MSSKRYSSLLLTALFASSTVAANAGSKSMLDPYAAVQAPPSKKPAARAQSAHDIGESTHTTYISMPMPAEEKAVKKGGMFSKAPKQAKQAKPVTVAETKQQDDSGDGIAAKSLSSMKNAGSGIMDGTKAAGSKFVEGSKAVGGGIATGTKKIGGGIATGAKASGGYFMKGVSAIGNGFKATGEKVKGGAGAAGDKVAGLPKLWGGKKDNQEKAKQQAIAKAVAERKAAKDPAQATQQAPSAEQENELATSPDAAGELQTTADVTSPVATPAAQAQSKTFTAKKAQPKSQSGKLAGISGGFSKAFGKLNPFAGGNGSNGKPMAGMPQHAVVRPQSQIQSTASSPDAIPQ